MKYPKIWFVVIALLMALSLSQPGLAQGHGPAPLYGTDSPTAIPGRYIVVFENTVGKGEMEMAMERVRAQGGEIHFTYGAAIKGFAASLPEQALKGLQTYLVGVREKRSGGVRPLQMSDNSYSVA